VHAIRSNVVIRTQNVLDTCSRRHFIILGLFEFLWVFLSFLSRSSRVGGILWYVIIHIFTRWWACTNWQQTRIHVGYMYGCGGRVMAVPGKFLKRCMFVFSCNAAETYASRCRSTLFCRLTNESVKRINSRESGDVRGNYKEVIIKIDSRVCSRVQRLYSKHN